MCTDGCSPNTILGTKDLIQSCTDSIYQQLFLDVSVQMCLDGGKQDELWTSPAHAPYIQNRVLSTNESIKCNEYSKRYHNGSQIIGQLSMSMQRDSQIRKHNFDISTKIKQHIAKTGAFCIPAIVQLHKFQNPFWSGVLYITPIAKAPPPHWHWSNVASIKL